MPIPLIAAGAGYELLNHLFNKSPEYTLPPSPTFFGDKFNHMLTAIKQRNEAAYGGAGSNIIESLNNQGFGQSGAVPQALTQLGIAQGQGIASAEGDAIQNEYNNQQNFATGPEYNARLGKAGVDYTRDVNARTTQLGDLNDIAKLIGGELFKPKTAAPAVATDTSAITGQPGFGPQHNTRLHDVLKLLFGINT